MSETIRIVHDKTTFGDLDWVIKDYMKHMYLQLKSDIGEDISNLTVEELHLFGEKYPHTSSIARVIAQLIIFKEVSDSFEEIRHSELKPNEKFEINFETHIAEMLRRTFLSVAENTSSFMRDELSKRKEFVESHKADDDWASADPKHAEIMMQASLGSFRVIGQLRILEESIYQHANTSKPEDNGVKFITSSDTKEVPKVPKETTQGLLIDMTNKGILN
jgi:hypothetical protein